MFQRNDDHRQRGLFDGPALFPERLRERLATSWAGTFYREVFCRIDETIFAGLYSETASRPNVPVNVLVALEVLKSEFGWSDEELYDQLCFNVQVRYAVGMTDLGAKVFRLRTLYNFRKRVRLHAERTGEDLFARVFEQVTDAQLKAVGVKTGRQRVDSTQVRSNVADQSRLELVIAVVQKVWAEMAAGLEETQREAWAERLSPYVGKRPHEISYRIPAGEVEGHLRRLGAHLEALARTLREAAPASEARALAERVLREQYAVEEATAAPETAAPEDPTSEASTSEASTSEDSASEDSASGEAADADVVELEDLPSEEEPPENGRASGPTPSEEEPSGGEGSPGEGSPESADLEGIEPRPGAEIGADSLQSPHDPEATYRRKGGEDYRGGYVVAVSETCDPSNDVQLITDVQVAPNTTDDAELLARSLEAQSERDLAVDQMTTDGGFTGPTGETACSDHEVQLRPTRVRGGRCAPGRLRWEDYTWILGEAGEAEAGDAEAGDAEGRPVAVVCPEGQRGTIEPGKKEGRLIARFEPGACAGCPLRGGACRVEERCGQPTLYVRERSVEVARLRQGIRPEDRSVRAPVEATMRSIKRGLRRGPGGHKLPTRGEARAKMVIYGAALMVNMRRLHRYEEQNRAEKRSAADKEVFVAFLWALRAVRRASRWNGGTPRRRGLRFG
jgi:hypothetical protein